MRLLDWVGVNPMKWFTGDEEVASRLIKMTKIVSQTTDADDIAQAFYEILEPVKNRLPWSFAPLFISRKLSSGVLAKELHWGFRLFAGRFIGGNDVPSIARTITEYQKKGIKVNLDILGDAVVSEREAQKYVDDYIYLFSELPKFGINISDISASIKISAAYSQIDLLRSAYAVDVIVARFKPFFELAQKRGFNIFSDGLERDYREIQFQIFERFYTKYGDIARFVHQSYFKDSLFDRLIRLRAHVGADLWVRLVLGAYHAFEQYQAHLRSWDIPVETEKECTNHNFRRDFKKGITHKLHMVSGTHNMDHILFALKNGSFESQLIRGMGEPHAEEVLIPNGLPARMYVPVVLSNTFSQGIGFLIRRVDDNRGPESFLAKNSGALFKTALSQFKKEVRAWKGGRR